MKRVCKLLLSVLFVLTALFACVGCTTKDKVKCAPCTVDEIWAWNEKVYKEFFYLRANTGLSGDVLKFVKCEVNGEEWDIIRRLKEDLTEGKHTIVFYTPEGFTIPIRKIVGGERVQKDVPYERKITLTVKISNDYEDICDVEYREAHGLWVDPTREEWYKKYRDKELIELGTPPMETTWFTELSRKLGIYDTKFYYFIARNYGIY